ncbi:hypothetical protein Mal33_00130 [Rosistilla oblonga]|uniref:Uncharacterized protein n=1 Tax=Rosistilla oblonga TaxID=2527990 RepID=A0A518ILV5_9BACT|nr:hypothetical protein Mal33_00130 [Rosistilla oblonga]
MTVGVSAARLDSSVGVFRVPSFLPRSVDRVASCHSSLSDRRGRCLYGNERIGVGQLWRLAGQSAAIAFPRSGFGRIGSDPKHVDVYGSRRSKPLARARFPFIGPFAAAALRLSRAPVPSGSWSAEFPDGSRTNIRARFSAIGDRRCLFASGNDRRIFPHRHVVAASLRRVLFGHPAAASRVAQLTRYPVTFPRPFGSAGSTVMVSVGKPENVGRGLVFWTDSLRPRLRPRNR